MYISRHRQRTLRLPSNNFKSLCWHSKNAHSASLSKNKPTLLVTQWPLPITNWLNSLKIFSRRKMIWWFWFHSFIDVIFIRKKAEITVFKITAKHCLTFFHFISYRNKIFIFKHPTNWLVNGEHAQHEITFQAKECSIERICDGY